MTSWQRAFERSSREGAPEGLEGGLTDSAIAASVNLWEKSQEIADEVVDHFSTLHPHIRLNRQEWQDLHEMIEREVYSHFIEGDSLVGGASDLLRKPEEAH